MTVALIATAAAGLVCLTVPAVVAVRRRFVVVTVAGTSMTPALLPGDRVLVRRAGVRRIRTGDIIVLGPSARGSAEPLIIKRAAALPGDLIPREAAAVLDPPEEVVPEGKLILLGDNREISVDSRQAGYFDAQRLIGHVIRRFPAPQAVGGL